MSRYVDSTEQLVVEIFVRDVERAKAFYRQLGFDLLRDDGTFVVMGWEDHQLYLDERRDLPPPPDFPQANTRIMVPDVDRYWRQVTDMGLPVISPIQDREYGLRDFTVLDPDGFGIRFGTRLPSDGS